MEFIVRRCRSGDETALSLLGRATFLETYAGRSEAADLLAYAETEHSIESYRLWLANEFAHIWAVETAVGRSAIGYLVALISPNAVSGPEIEIKRLSPAGTYSQAIRSNGPLVFSSRQTPRGLDGQRLVGRRLSNRRASLSTISRRSRAPADFRSDMP